MPHGYRNTFFSGTVYVTHANVSSIVPVECLTGGHSATVRCVHWEHQVFYHVIHALSW